jgi:hypothetical protein
MSLGERTCVLEMDVRIVERRTGVAQALQDARDGPICEEHDHQGQRSERQE